MNIQERILDALKERDTTQRELGFAIKVSPSTLNNWLNLKRNIPSEFIIPICEFLCVSVNWLLTGEGEMNKQTIDIQPKVLDEEKLDIDEELLLSNYKKLDKNSKVEFLNLIILKTLEVPKGKLYHSANAKDEVLTAYELERIAS